MRPQDMANQMQSEERRRRQSRDLALLHQVRTALAQELDLWSVFYTVVEAVAKTYGYTQVSAYLLEGDELVLQHEVGYERAIERIPVAEGVSGRAVRTRQPILLEDVRSDPDFIGAIDGITSEICVPLIEEDEVIGFLNVESTNGVRLTQDDLELIIALGEHVSVAASRAQLYTRVRRSEERFRAMTQNSSDLVTLLRADGTIRYQSPSAERIIGYRPDELIGQNAFSYVHPDDLERVEMAFAEGLKDPKRHPKAEYRFRHKDGSWRWLDSVGSNLLGDPGVGEYVVNSRDVTERKEAEEALREAEERYRTLVEQIPAVTYIDPADDSDTSLYTSPQVEKMLGYTSEEWHENKLWSKCLHPDDRERVLAADERFEAGGEPFSEEYRLIAKDGSVVWVREEAVAVRNKGGRPLYWQGVILDVTERKEAEDAVRRSEASLAESQRMAHLGTWEWDVKTDEVWWSDETFRIYGFEPDELVPTFETLVEVVHPEDRNLLREAIAGALYEHKSYDFEHRIIRPSGEVRWVHRQAEVVRGEAREPLRMIGTVHDITERKVLEEKLRYQAFRDLLTNLPNRHLFVDRLKQALRRSSRRRGSRVAVLFMDLDGFKIINDSVGHDVGDRLLVAVSERLKGSLRPEDTLARFGGDEFVVLLEDVEGPEDAVRVAERITGELQEPMMIEGRELFVRASIGIALGDDRQKSSEDLLRDADTAMYRAKDEAADYKVFDEAMYERAIGRLELENDLRRAIEREEFVVYYQPIFNLQTGGLWGMEALVRWEHPERGILDPDEFVPIAEESGLVVPMGEKVLKEACNRAVQWQSEYPRTPPLAMSVNLSGRQLRRQGLHKLIEQALKESGLPASSLGLDITETVYISALDADTAALDRLRATGIRISIDDFGSGYSSLSYLKRLPADILKIDKSFVRDLGLEVEDTAIAQTIIDLAHILGMEVVAEGVELEEQETLLKEMGCDFGQGFYFSEPLPPEAVPGFLADRSSGGPKRSFLRRRLSAE
ncbi:MAG: EAL domain-containing protein [Actinomycetota bacterium]|nr:EAL domain-containing protein [Actinomycetota bacterium]